MTTASELNSAAVVEVERRGQAGKEVAVKAKAMNDRNNALKQEERCSLHDDTGFKFGGTTATATNAVALEEVEAAEIKATSGSKAAFDVIAASTQATGLPVSVFSRAFFETFSETLATLSPGFHLQEQPGFSFIKLHIQQSPVPLWPNLPERFLRANCAA